MAATASLAPKIGPLGLQPKKVGDDIAKATESWKGLRVTVKLTVQNRAATVEVVPSAAALVIRALKEPPRDRKKDKNSAWAWARVHRRCAAACADADYVRISQAQWQPKRRSDLRNCAHNAAALDGARAEGHREGDAGHVPVRWLYRGRCVAAREDTANQQRRNRCAGTTARRLCGRCHAGAVALMASSACRRLRCARWLCNAREPRWMCRDGVARRGCGAGARWNGGATRWPGTRHRRPSCRFAWAHRPCRAKRAPSGARSAI